MRKLRSVDRIRRCTHQRTVCVISDGLERVICEDCGDVTVRYEAMISGELCRSKFARKTDTLHSEPKSSATV